jgi:hypothetical protein
MRYLWSCWLDSVSKVLPVWGQKRSSGRFSVYTQMWGTVPFLAVHLGKKPAIIVQKWSFHRIGISFSTFWPSARA